MENHEKGCPHRPVSCLECEKSLALSDQKKHLMDDHGRKTLSCCFVMLSEPQATDGIVASPINLPLDGEMVPAFWCQKHDSHTLERRVWVCHGGNPEEKYYYGMRVFGWGQDRDDRNIPVSTYIGKCPGYDSNFSGNTALTISEECLNSIAHVNDNGDKTILVRIRLARKDEGRPFEFGFLGSGH